MGRPLEHERAATFEKSKLTCDDSNHVAEPSRKRLKRLLFTTDGPPMFTFPPESLKLPTPLTFPPTSRHDRRPSSQSSTSTVSYSTTSSSLSSLNGSRKRSRDLTRDDTISRKKRRLRLTLITSRLSLPFSQPPTHIIDKGSSRIAVWAKQKALGRGALRKVAILNWVRRKFSEERKQLTEGKGSEIDDTIAGGQVRSPNAGFANADIRRRISVGGSAYVAQVSKRDYVPPPPSPLGLSNYDALDDEDDFHDEAWSDDDGEGSSGNDLVDWSGGASRSERAKDEDVYSDWNIRNPTSHDGVGGDAEGPHEPELDFFGAVALPPEIVQEKRPPSPPDEKMAEMLKEKERQREVLGAALKFF